MENLLNTNLGEFYTNGTSKRLIRHDFFKNIQTEIQAYLLGFIMADGSVDEKRNTLSIHLKSIDKEIINLFLEYISPSAYTDESEGNTFVSRGKTYTSSTSIRVSISSKIIINDLKKLGITQSKTWRELHIPDIPEDLIRHFIRGYFDGDGCFTYSIRKPNIKNREKNFRVSSRVEICSKRQEILEDIRSFINRKLGTDLNINYITRDDMYRMCTSKRDSVISIFHMLYDDSLFYLERKFNKYNYYVNTEITQIITEYRNAQEVNVNESNNPPTSSEHPIIN